MEEKTFNSSRLRFARKRRGITIKRLASIAGMSSKIISDYENGAREPPERTLLIIAKELHFPVQFFFSDDLPGIDELAVSFRSFSTMSASVRDSALGAAQIALVLSQWIDSRFKLPDVDLPDLREHTPEAAANTLRNIFTIGELPIGNIIHLLESRGIRVFSLDEKTLDMDAYSFWMDGVPFVFTNTKKSVERSRFDAAHELGHLVLHKHGASLGRKVEQEANQFASAFLMPSGSVRAKSPKFPTLDFLITLKRHWGVSASALVRRMYDLNLLSDWYYRNFMIELSKRGRNIEPNPITQRETSKLWPMVFKALKEDGLGREDIAKIISVYVDDIDALVFNLTIINGGKSEFSPSIKPSHAHLTRIK